MSLSKKLMLLFGDVVVLYVSLLSALYLRGGGELAGRFVDVYLVPFTILNVLWLAVFFLYDFYSFRTFRSRTGFFEVFSQAILVNALLAIAFFYFAQVVFEITPKTNLAVYLAVFSLLFILWRLVFGRWLKRGMSQEKIFFALSVEPEMPIMRELHRYPFHTLVSSADQADRIVSDRVDADLFERYSFKGAAVSELSSYVQDALMRIPVELVEDDWLIRALARKDFAEYAPVKRVADVIVAAFGLVTLSPLSVAIMLIVRFSSSGPALYRQTRLGLLGKPFTMYKFRTMSRDAEAAGAQWAVKGDKRVTAVGRVLRHTHLDEIPQLWNILRGDMSFVGPRPEQPEIAQELERMIPHYRLRHLVKPGLTGWAQVNAGYGATIEMSRLKLSYDLYYALNQSMIFDVKILLSTAASVIKGEQRI